MLGRILLIIGMVALGAAAPAQKTMWARTITSQAASVGSDHRVCTDNENNFYVIANFTDVIRFGEDIVLKSENRTGPTDAFIAKIDPEGKRVIWGQQIKGFGDIKATSVCTDNDGNVIVGGSFQEDANFGGNNKIKAEVKDGFFVAKYNRNGAFMWVKHGGNYYSKFPLVSTTTSALKTDPEGNIYMAASILGMSDDWVWDKTLPVEEQYIGKGYFEGRSINGLITGNQTVVFKLKPDGSKDWHRANGVNLFMKDMDLDGDQNIYLTGALVGQSWVGDKRFESNGLQDILVMKLNKSGLPQWTKEFGRGEPISSGKGPLNDLETGSFISVNKQGNVFVSGQHFNGARFGNQSLESNAFLNDTELGNMFVAMLSSEGEVQWVKNNTAKGSSFISGMVCDSKGNVFVSALIGLKKAQFDGKGARGAFIAKFNNSGGVEWIDDADKRSGGYITKAEKVDISLPGGLAINATEDFLYCTGNATKVTSSSALMSELTGVKRTSRETIIAVSKVKTD